MDFTDNLVQLDDQVRTKPGIKLPKADSGWELANLFFKSELSTSDINRDNLNETIASMNSTIYNYFAENYGTDETDNKKDNDLLEKYGEFSVNNLKKRAEEVIQIYGLLKVCIEKNKVDRSLKITRRNLSISIKTQYMLQITKHLLSILVFGNMLKSSLIRVIIFYHHLTRKSALHILKKF